MASTFILSFSARGGQDLGRKEVVMEESSVGGGEEESSQIGSEEEL